MNDLDDLRRVLAARERLAPEPARMITDAVARGRRLRRARRAYQVAAVVTALALAAAGGLVLWRPGRLQPGAPTSIPGYLTVDVPGGGRPVVDGPPGTGRPLDVTRPDYRLTGGWHEYYYAAQDGLYRARLVNKDRAVNGHPPIVTLDVMAPAPGLRPAGDHYTGQPDAHGVLAWQEDSAHFVRLTTKGAVDQDLYRKIGTTFDVNYGGSLGIPINIANPPANTRVVGVEVTVDPKSQGFDYPHPGGYIPPHGWGVALWVTIPDQSGAPQPASFRLTWAATYPKDNDDAFLLNVAKLVDALRSYPHSPAQDALYDCLRFDYNSVLTNPLRGK